jgi:hypothetical protein
MKYIIKRASEWNDEISPCEEAKKETIIYKDNKEKVWMIKINTIKDLMNLQYKYGDIIIGDSIRYKGYHEILIYDDYIE